jgi:hypothetical protein
MSLATVNSQAIIELLPRIPMKSFINRNSQTGDLYNIGKVQSLGMVPNNFFFNDLPTVSDYIAASRKKTSQFDWAAWLGAKQQRSPQSKTMRAGLYEKFTVYVRIIPSDFGIDNVPKPNSPQIWKLVFVNGEHLLQAKPIYTIYDTLPISISQPLEDGFALQTKSIAEAQIPIQEAASLLFNIRFNSARRAVSDRALYDPSLISADDVNSREPAPKLPVRLSGLNDKKLTDAYEQIPYDAHATDGVIGDARNVLELGDQLSGLNKPQQGRFQKGNKSVKEWDDTMASADNRPRLPALSLEFQFFIPLKEQMKLNIYQNGVQGSFQNFRTGNVYTIKPEDVTKLKEKVLTFRIADGYTPKSKMAASEMITAGIQAISQSQILAQALGAALPNMFAHMMQLGGVRGLDQYLPQQQTQQQAPNGQPGTPAAT